MINILIVEDDAAISNLIQMNLTAEGYHCTCAHDGRDGANCIEQNVYDLVLLDIMLPEINGYELLEYIKPTGTPVIFLTAKGDLKDPGERAAVRGGRLCGEAVPDRGIAGARGGGSAPCAQEQPDAVLCGSGDQYGVPAGTEKREERRTDGEGI